MTDSHEPRMDQRPKTPRWVLALGGGLLAVILLAILVMVLGGGQHGPGMHLGGGGAPASPSASAASDVGAGEPADESEARRTVEITTADAMRFEPAAIAVAPGEVVTFVVTNSGQAAHEFTLGDAAMQQEHAEAMGHMPAGMRHDLPNSVALEPGETES